MEVDSDNQHQQQQFEILPKASNRPQVFRRWILPDGVDIRVAANKYCVLLRISNEKNDWNEKPHLNPFYSSSKTCFGPADQLCFEQSVDKIKQQSSFVRNFEYSQTIILHFYLAKDFLNGISLLQESWKTVDKLKQQKTVTDVEFNRLQQKVKLPRMERQCHVEMRLDPTDDCVYVSQFTGEHETIRVRFSRTAFQVFSSLEKEIKTHMHNVERSIQYLRHYVIFHTSKVLRMLLTSRCGLIKEEFFSPPLKKPFQREFKHALRHFMTMGYVESLVDVISQKECKFTKNGKPFALDINSIVHAILKIHSDELFTVDFFMY